MDGCLSPKIESRQTERGTKTYKNEHSTCMIEHRLQGSLPSHRSFFERQRSHARDFLPRFVGGSGSCCSALGFLPRFAGGGGLRWSTREHVLKWRRSASLNPNEYHQTSSCNVGRCLPSGEASRAILTLVWDRL
jgi:hypothetical protein